MADFYLRSSSATERANSTVYALGARVVIARSDAQTNNAIMRRYVYEATVVGGTGTSAAAPPIYPTTPGTTVADGDITWTCRECTSWTNANLYLDYLATRTAAGDTIYVSHAHAESVAAAITLAFNGTGSFATKVLCVNDGAQPPTTMADTATITTTGTSAITVTGSVYWYGLRLFCGTGPGSASIALNSDVGLPQAYEACKFNLVATGIGGRILAGRIGNLGGSAQHWKNCEVGFGGSNQGIGLNGTRFRWSGGALVISGGAVPDALFFGSSTNQGRASDALVEGLVIPVGAENMSLAATTDVGSHLVFRNCQLPVSWAGSLVAAPAAGIRVEMHNVDSVDTNYRLAVADSYNAITTQTGTRVRSGGASDGSTTYSWKMTSDTLNFSLYVAMLESPEIARWNATVGVPVTVAVETLYDSATALTDGEVWLEVQYLGTSGVPLGSFVSDARATPLTAAVAQTSSSATWDTTGMANPKPQTLSVTFTPQEAGYLHARVVLAKPGITIYVDPKLQVS